MNRKQRKQNRVTAALLVDQITICPECGEHGRHWVGGTLTLTDLLAAHCGKDPGFWVCPRLYGTDGRRLQS